MIPRFVVPTAVAGVIASSIAFTWLFPAAFRGLPLVAPDTASYQAWDPLRPLLYPAFLNIVMWIDPGLQSVGAIQFAALLGSTAMLALSIAHHLRAPVMAVGFAGVTLWHPQVVSYAFTALPESFLMTVSMAHLTALILLFDQVTTTRGLTYGATLAVALLLKPVALAWLGGLPLLLMAVGGTARGKLLALILATVTVPLTVACVINYSRLGIFSPQFGGGYATLGVTATLLDRDSPLQPAALRDALVTRLAPIRQELESLDSLEFYYFFSSHAYHLTMTESQAVIDQYFGTSDTTTAISRYTALNQIGGSVARAGIIDSPGQYLRHVAAHLYGLWLMPLVRNASDDSFARDLGMIERTAPILASTPLMYRTVPAAAYWPYKVALVVTLAVSLLSLAMMIAGRRQHTWSAVAYAAALLHVYFLLTAAAQTGLPRYALAAWPLTSFVLCVGVSALGKDARLASRRHRATADATRLPQS